MRSLLQASRDLARSLRSLRSGAQLTTRAGEHVFRELRELEAGRRASKEEAVARGLEAARAAGDEPTSFDIEQAREKLRPAPGRSYRKAPVTGARSQKKKKPRGRSRGNKKKAA